MEILLKRFSAEYPFNDDTFDNLTLIEAKIINADFNLSVSEIASLGFGEIGYQLVPFNPMKKKPNHILDYLIRDGRILWNLEPYDFSLNEFFEVEEIKNENGSELNLVEPLCIGSPDPDAYTILVSIYEDINKLFQYHPFGIVLMGVVFSHLKSKVYPKVKRYFDEQYVYGMNHINLKKFLYSKEFWELNDLSYKLKSDNEVADEILKMYGFVKEKDSNTYVLKYRIDILDSNELK